jgi:hypothetical protein
MLRRLPPIPIFWREWSSVAADVMSGEPTMLPFEVAELVWKNSHMAVGVKFHFLPCLLELPQSL